MKPGTFDPPELVPYLYEGATGTTAWDVGCSYGNMTTQLMARFDNVYGFDPSTMAMAYLSSIPPTKGVQIMKIALSDHEGKVDLKLEEGPRRVYCRSIDGLTQTITMPDFIKVDVEGHEVHVLRGAEFTMISRGPSWLIEVYSAQNGQECMALLSAFGYKNTVVLDPNDRDPVNHYWIRAVIPASDG